MDGRSFLILHGIENHRPPEHWQHWLASRLNDRGHQVLYPGLPDPDTPSYPVWESTLRSLLAEMTGEERVVICHSLACLLWLRAAPALEPGERVDRLMLAAPPAPERVPEGGSGFRFQSFDADAVRESVKDQILIVCGDSDPYNPTGAQALYADPLGERAIVIPHAGHITPDDGYGPWPWVERWCEDAESAV